MNGINKERAIALVPVLAGPAAVLAVQPRLLPWVFMWSLAIAIYFGCKWLTYRNAVLLGARPEFTLAAGYLLAYPGMDANAFFGRPRSRDEEGAQWSAALRNIGVGVSLLLVAVVNPVAVPGLIRGWIGMAGAVLVLHFGVFQLMSLAWRSRGVNASLLMVSPHRTVSLSEFWNRRWNTAFHHLASNYLLRTLSKFIPKGLAAVLVFAASGVVHDLVISVPAQSGYGLPTAYFLIQGFGVLLQRSGLGRSLRLNNGWRGRSFAFVVVALPAPMLFHAGFVERVILPMLDAIGTLIPSSNSFTLGQLVQGAAVLHLGLMAAGLMMPKVVNLKKHLKALPPFVRQLFWVYYAFIGLCLVGFAVISFTFADAMASGTPLARALCAFLAIFWLLRLAAGLFVFELEPYLKTPLHRVGLALANIVFGLLPIVYAIGAIAPEFWKGGTR
jgi:hypothetical protein